MASHGNPWGSWQSMALHTLHGSLGVSTQQEVVSNSWAISESISNEYRTPWMPMVVHRSPWQSMGPLAVHAMGPLAVHGSSPWQPLAVHCTPSVPAHGRTMQSMAFSSGPWQSMVVCYSISNVLLLVTIRTVLHGCS